MITEYRIQNNSEGSPRHEPWRRGALNSIFEDEGGGTFMSMVKLDTSKLL
jgi:hypothetical protein